MIAAQYMPGARSAKPRRWAAIAAAGLLLAAPAARSAPYAPIEPTLSDQTVMLTGHDLTIDQVMQIARHGAKVQVSPEALRHQQDALGLLMEAAVEGVPVEGFNRGRDGDRETILFDGDPAAPEVAAAIAGRALAAFRKGAPPADAEEVPAEDAVRALMAVRANTLVYTPATAPILQILLDFLNDRITPVVAAPEDAPGLPAGALANVAAAMVGLGEVHYLGKRMPAADALAQAGLQPVAPAAIDDRALIDTDTAEIAQTALVLADAKRALDWADLVAAMEMDGQASAIAALSLPAQGDRPYVWLNWEAARVLDMLKGSYLLTEDAASFPAGPGVRLAPQGAAWRAWGALRETALIALNSCDQTPAVRVGLSPRETPELSAPQMMRYFVKGGRASGGKRGFIVPTANRADAPLAGDVAAFGARLRDMLRDWRGQAGDEYADRPDSPPTARAALAVDDAFQALAKRFAAAAAAMDRRLTENPARAFGPAPTGALADFRKLSPGGDDAEAMAARFLRATLVESYYPKADPTPGADAPISPSALRLAGSPRPTMMWSWIAMPSGEAARAISRVISTSARDGVGSPEGWLCTRISAVAPTSSARFTTSRT